MLYRILILLFLPFTAICQNTIGLPDVINYSKGTYRAGLQNWDIRQDQYGIIYLANNEGLLSYDGTYWNLFPLPNKTIVRSLEISEDGRIYVGGQDELGYFEPASNGQLEYHSLAALIPAKDKSFGDVWDIITYKKSIFFRASNKIFQFSNESMTTYNAPSEWSYLGKCNGNIYAHDYKTGLLSFTDNAWTPLAIKTELPLNDPITAIVQLPHDSSIITTLKNGLYLFSKASITKIQAKNSLLFENERIYAATTVNDEWVALATNKGGVYIIDQKENIIQRFSRTEGLQNNNVLSIFMDKQNNLWLGLDNGIDFIAYNSAIKHITPNSLDASGYTAIIHHDQLYTGTSAGLFTVALQPVRDLSFSKGVFSEVANTSGQTWGLASINDQLLLGHHEGAFVVNDKIAKPISANKGFWNFVPLSAVYPSARVIGGNYKGLSFFNYDNNAFSLAENIPVFDESSRFVAIDKFDNIWVSHPYHGVYKITKAPDGNYKIKLFTAENGLPSTLNNHVYKIKNEVVVATEKGVFMYNPSKDLFESSAYYKNILGQQSIRYLKEDTEGNIWFIHEKNLGVVDMSSNKPTIIYLPELNNKLLSGFEFIYPVNENNIFIGGEKGFLHINFEKYKKNIPELMVHLSAVRIIDNKDSLLFGGYYPSLAGKQRQDEIRIYQIDNNWKTIRFEYASPLFGQQNNLEFSYRLEGFNEHWAQWSDKTEKEYTNLPAGTYTFEVKVRNNLGNESGPVIYKFTILPPWYQTKWAYISYFLICCLLIYLLYLWTRKKFQQQQARYEEEQKKIQYLYQLEINKAENELVALRNEKLQAEVDYKNAELATSAMHLVQKGEILTKIKTELNQVMKVLSNEKEANELKKMIKVLGEDDKMDKDWEHFAQHFDKVHNDFVVKLKEKHAGLSGNELKLCAYLRMNLSTKEMAQLMNISVRGVEISRYRLRKKLGIATEVSLFEYLMKVE